MKFKFSIFLFCCLIITDIFSLSTPYLSADFWFIPEKGGEFDPVKKSYSERDILFKVFDEARFVFSGMLYGFTFSYTPSDAARNVSESYNIELLHEIELGDPSLNAVETWESQYKHYITLEYKLAPFQSEFLNAWNSNTIPVVTGTGEGSFYTGLEGKLESIKISIKNGIRNYLRVRRYNKPKQIKGRALLWEPPAIRTRSGKFIADVNFKLLVDEIEDYTTY